MDFTRNPSLHNTEIKDSSFESTRNNRMINKPDGHSSKILEDGLTEDQINWLLEPSSTDKN